MVRSHLRPALATALAAAAAGCGGSQSIVNPQGPQASLISDLWWVFFALCMAVFAAVTIALAIAILPRRSRPARDGDIDPAREARARRTVVGALVVTVLIFLALVGYSTSVSRALTASPADEAGVVEIDVIGHQWWWEVRYRADQPERQFTTANELRIPVGRPVVVRGMSRDVIHSFWVPNLHGKIDFIPGRTTSIWFQADAPGTWRGQCAEFCGLQHALMAFTVVAMPEAEFETWRTTSWQRGEMVAPNPAPGVARGREVFIERQCSLCHTIRGTGAWGRAGPDLTRIGSRTTIAAGTLPNTRGHLAAWILDPQTIKPGNHMPPTALEPQDLHALLDYLESLQ